MVPAENAHYVAATVPHGRAVILPGRAVISSGDVDAIAAAVEDGLRHGF